MGLGFGYDNNFGNNYYEKIELQQPQTNSFFTQPYLVNVPESQLEQQIPGLQQSPRFGVSGTPSPSVGIPDYIADMSEGNNRRGHYPQRTTFDSVPVGNSYSPRGGAVGRSTGNLPHSMASTSTNYNYGRNPYQGAPDGYYRGGSSVANNTVNNQPAKSKNKNEWNYYINQAAAVGKNKSASVPLYEENNAPQQEASYTNWGPTSASIDQGTVFNGLAPNNFTPYNQNNNLR